MGARVGLCKWAYSRNLRNIQDREKDPKPLTRNPITLNHKPETLNPNPRQGKRAPLVAMVLFTSLAQIVGLAFDRARPIEETILGAGPGHDPRSLDR